jgi:hypothetical protein
MKYAAEMDSCGMIYKSSSMRQPSNIKMCAGNLRGRNAGIANMRDLRIMPLKQVP